jgi:hypothetical protein
VKLDDIEDVVCKREDVTRRQLRDRSRISGLCRLRWEVWWAANEFDVSIKDLAKAFDLDPATVRHGIHRHALYVAEVMEHDRVVLHPEQ